MENVCRLILGHGAPVWREKPPALDYGALARRVRETLPPAGPADISSREGLALARLKTLSRKPFCGCPDDAGVDRALWLCLGAAAFPEDRERTGTRLRAAAEAVLAMTHGAPPREREALRSRCGEPAEAMARLLYYAITTLKGG